MQPKRSLAMTIANLVMKRCIMAIADSAVKRHIFTACSIAALFLLPACSKQIKDQDPTIDPGQSPASRITLKAKTGPKTICYVEVNSNNILNVGSYTLTTGGQQLFDYAIIFAANINADPGNFGYGQLYFNSNVSTVLSGKSTYIAPLQSKGIKVLLDVLGNHTGLGICNFTSRAAAHDFAVQCSNAVSTYGLDGIDFDDEYAEYGNHGYPYDNDSSFVILLQELHSTLPAGKTISFYAYGPAYSHQTYQGNKAGSYLNDAWNAIYGSWSVPSVSPLGKANLSPSAVWIDNTSTSTAASLASQTISNGYGLFLTYDLHGTNEATYLSSVSQKLYGSKTSLSGPIYSWP